MTPDELRAQTAWLEKLCGSCPWSIDTAHDLREFASNVLSNPDDDLTFGEVRRIQKLFESLKPPESHAEFARRAKKEARRTKKKLATGLAHLTPLERAFRLPLEKEDEKWRPWQAAGARARMKNSKRADIISHWQKLRHLPPRERASVVAEKHDVTSRYVRKVIQTANLRPGKKRTNQI